MKRFFLYVPAVFAALCIAAVSCGEDESIPIPVTEPEEELPGARITDTIRYEKQKATVYNIEYPSADPYGYPVMLSGAIVVGDEVMEGRDARGMVLYNHYTVYGKDQCPSCGYLDMPMMFAGSGLITVAPDYYGFGATEDRNQAYCMSWCNGKGSADALIAARWLLGEAGFRWDGFLFNVGYSQGAQTSMGVLRYCSLEHPEIEFTHTIAGDGPYDMAQTYRCLVEEGSTDMPSTVVSSLMAYNEYCQLGYDISDMFTEPGLSRIKSYLQLPQDRRGDFDSCLGDVSLEECVSPELMDLESDMSARFMEAFERDNLAKGWTPDARSRITLVHNKLDDVVPVGNTTSLQEFLEKQGLVISTSSSDRYNPGTVYVLSHNWSGSNGMGRHTAAALYFATEVVISICSYLDMDLWFSLSDLGL